MTEILSWDLPSSPVLCRLELHCYKVLPDKAFSKTSMYVSSLILLQLLFLPFPSFCFSQLSICLPGEKRDETIM